MTNYKAKRPQVSIMGTKLQIATLLSLFDEMSPGFIEKRKDNPGFRACETCPPSACHVTFRLMPDEYLDITRYAEKATGKKLPDMGELYPDQILDEEGLRVLRSQSGFSITKRNRRNVKPR